MHGVEALLGSPVDARCSVPGELGASPAFLDDVGGNPVLLLHRARLYPAERLPEDATRERAAFTWRGHALVHRQHAPLLLAERHALIAPSAWLGQQWPTCVVAQGDAAPVAHLPPVRRFLPGLWLHLDMVTRHFGHALVDTPSRAWAIERLPTALQSSIGIVAFAGHGLSGAPDTWPHWLQQYLEGKRPATSPSLILDAT